MTRNAAARLKKTLAAIATVDAPRCWSLVVIDNGSIDDTRQVVRNAERHLPIHCIHEPRRGKNAGCNAAIPFIEGELAVFTDDDVVPARDWLTEFEAAARAHPDYDVFGGRIEPIWPREPEPWILEWVPLSVAYAVTPDWPSGPIKANCVWGGSMAIRPRVFAAGHRFDPTIGPDGSSNYAMGGETEFLRRLERAGHRAWHVPRAVVRHSVREHQLTRAWIRRRAYRCGRGVFRIEGLAADLRPPFVLGVPGRMMAPLMRTAWRWLSHHVRSNGRLAFQAEWSFAFQLGQIYEARLARRALRALPEHAPSGREARTLARS